MPIKIDLHVHSHYSSDSLITPEELVIYAKKRGLDGVAVTDHDRLDSALKIARETSFFILPGMEISSSNGHIVALNVQEPICKGLGAEETVDEIHRAGGIAVACHPTAFFKGSLGKHATSVFDAIEVINASSFPFNYSVKNAQKIANRLEIAQVAGSDAHYPPEIGYAYTLVNASLDIDEIVRSIQKRSCQPIGKAVPLKLKLKKELRKLRRNKQ